jgi:lipopolysaccharide exporter
MSGTFIAQLIGIGAMPILTRLYSASDFGAFGIYIAVVTLLSHIISGKYELAIILPSKRQEALGLFWVSLIILLLSTTIVFVVVFFFSRSISNFFSITEAENYLIFLPAFLFVSGLYNVLTFWLTRNKKYKEQSISKITNTSTSSLVKISLGLVKLNNIGLLIGDFFGRVSSLLILLYTQKGLGKIELPTRKLLHTLRKIAYKYRRYPTYIAPQALINGVSQKMPGFILLYFFSSAIVGYYWLTMKLLKIPLELIVQALRQVYFQRAAELFNLNKSTLVLFKKTTISLLLISLLPATIILIAGPSIFQFVFGSEWRIAGVYSQVLTFWWVSSFINVPAVMSLHLLKMQRFHFTFETSTLIIRTIILFSAIYFLKSDVTAILLYSLSGMFTNIYLIHKVYTKLKQHTLGSQLHY